jgi:drug/metabolite transporter (DMT)-like permease
MSEYFGEIAALLTSVFWTITGLSFEVASRRVGSLSVNMIRLVMAFVFLGIFTWISRGIPFPVDAGSHAWIWLSISGLIGFVFGDYFLFRAFAMLSSRVTMLIMTLVPPITALIGWLFLKEVMNPRELLGMFMVVGGIGMAIMSRNPENKKKIRLNYPLKGLFFALLGTIGQAVGLVLSKYGMKEYDPFAATHIRIFAGMIGFAVIVILLKKQGLINTALKDKRGLSFITLGSIFGPFLGVSFSLVAVQNTATGVAATLMSLMPVLLIPPSILFFKHKITWPEIAGAFLSVIGVALFFLQV